MIKYNSYEGDYLKSNYKVTTVQEAINLAACELSNIGENFEQEGLFVITMNEEYEVRTVRLLALGSYNTISISSNEICKQAIRDNAKNVLILHNHPRSSSVSLQPSEADIRVTDRLLLACSLLDLSLIDHIIVSSTYQKDNRFFSMRQNNVLDFDFYNKIENLHFERTGSGLSYKWGR